MKNQCNNLSGFLVVGDGVNVRLHMKTKPRRTKIFAVFTAVTLTRLFCMGYSYEWNRYEWRVHGHSQS